MKSNTDIIQTSVYLACLLSTLFFVACIEQRGPLTDPNTDSNPDPLDYNLTDLSVAEDQQVQIDDQMISDLSLAPDFTMDALVLPPDQSVMPEPEVCNGRDDDLDGDIDEGLMYGNISDPIVISISNRIETAAPQLLLLPNQDFFAIWIEGRDGYSPTSIGAYINEEGIPTEADRLPIHHRHGHWHNAGYRVLGVKGGAVDPIGFSLGMFDASNQEEITPWNAIRNTLVEGIPAGVWTGERHIVVGESPEEDDMLVQTSSEITTYVITSEGELESQSSEVYPGAKAKGSIASAQLDERSIFVWGEGGQTLRLSIKDPLGDELYSGQLSDINYLFVGGKLNVQVAALQQKWIITVPIRLPTDNGAILVITVNRDGQEDQRYIAGENLIIDQQKLATHDNHAALMIRRTNGYIEIFSLSPSQVTGRRTFNRSPINFDIQAVGSRLYILGSYYEDLETSTESIQLLSLDCMIQDWDD